MHRVFSYVAIPSLDFERAFGFYTAVTGGLLRKNADGPFPMAYFHDFEGRDVGHLFELPPFRPSADGAIVYMELADDLNQTLEKITAAGGTVLMTKTAIGPGKGYWALFVDTEGNRLALHSSE